MAELGVVFCLPVAGAPRARFVSDYGLRTGQLLIDGQVVIEARSREDLERGVHGGVPGAPGVLTLRAAGPDDVHLLLDGEEMPREDRLRAPTSRAAWVHATIAFSGSLFGLIASALYLRRAHIAADPWALKMAFHMAAWHLLLTVTLFPLSVFGQRVGIRIVQGTSLVFFLIHLGIALANTGAAEGSWIAVLNAASGLAFLCAALTGFHAFKTMDPSI